MSDEAPVTDPTEPDHVPDLPHAHAVTWGVAELPHRGDEFVAGQSRQLLQLARLCGRA